VKRVIANENGRSDNKDKRDPRGQRITITDTGRISKQQKRNDILPYPCFSPLSLGRTLVPRLAERIETECPGTSDFKLLQIPKWKGSLYALHQTYPRSVAKLRAHSSEFLVSHWLISLAHSSEFWVSHWSHLSAADQTSGLGRSGQAPTGQASTEIIIL
jgi:hypothetical protein